MIRIVIKSLVIAFLIIVLTYYIPVRTETYNCFREGAEGTLRSPIPDCIGSQRFYGFPISFGSESFGGFAGDYFYSNNLLLGADFVIWFFTFLVIFILIKKYGKNSN